VRLFYDAFMRGLVRKAGFTLAVLGIVCGIYASYVLLSLPDVESLKRTNPTTTALMEQRAAERNGKARPIRSWVSYRRISPHLRNAVLVAEDGGFFSHSGFDLHELKESLKRNWEEGRFARGASTITQQLAKNLYLSTSKNPLRKIREFFIARKMEEQLGKERIFEIYLNVIEWGNGIYGIGPASQAYFGKPPSDLLPEEAAILAAMIPSPRLYSPARGPTKYLQTRKAELLRRMVRYRYLSQKEYESALERSVGFRKNAA
jgi:monofunctional biosynthetic peptidoglycan transglycosylase